MKKLFVLLLSLILCFALFACGEEAPEPEDSTEGDGGESATVELVKDGEALFRIVSTHETTEELGRVLANFTDTLNDCIDSGVSAVFEQTAAVGTEIIIGPVATRGDKYAEKNADPYAYGYDGWSVQMIDGNILVLAGSVSAYKDAFAYLEDTVFGIDDNTLSITDVTISAAQLKTVKQTEFDMTVTIDGNPLSEYVFAINSGDTGAIAAIKQVRDHIFKKTGVYLKTVTANNMTEDQKAIWIVAVELNGERSTPDGARIYVEDGSLIIETEFPDRLEGLACEFLTSRIVDNKNATVNFKNGLLATKNVRDIYYAEFGAVGDGETDDFFAIKACHDYANKWGHNVHADGADKTYYIGNYLGNSEEITSIIVKTDTNWHGCSFIFDDKAVPVDSGCYNSPIFHVLPKEGMVTYYGATLPFTSLAKDATDLGGWTPGFKALIILKDNTTRHFIRYGVNADSGLVKQEMIIVNPDGTIDESTPLHWDYERITSMDVYHCDDDPITITGGDDDERMTVKTIFNGAPSLYTYFWRNIIVERSNVTIQNINHVVEGEIPESEGGTGAPYKGFIRANYCADVLLQNITIHKLQSYHLETDASNTMGSYEMGSTASNNVTWRNIKQNVFYDEDGYVSWKGLMGSGYCKNMTLEDCMLHSFDAHQGIYNVTLRNSTFEHMNFIGDGTITLENVTVYIDPTLRVITLRADYGSWWRGDIVIKNLDLKYKDVYTAANKQFHLIHSKWYNHDFGYICYLPKNITMENVRMLAFKADMSSGTRVETVTAVNEKKLYLFSPELYSYTNVDISNPNAMMTDATNDWKKCECETFNDTDGNGRCNNTVKSPNGGNMWCNGWENEPDTTVNANPYIGTETVTVINADKDNPIKMIWPLTLQFKHLDVTVDGELIIDDGIDIYN